MLGIREPLVMEMAEETPFEFMQIGLKSFQPVDTMSPAICWNDQELRKLTIFHP